MGDYRAWTDEEIDAIAARIKRFGWPYKQHARGVVKVLLAEVDRLRPATDRGAVSALRAVASPSTKTVEQAEQIAREALARLGLPVHPGGR